MNTEQFNGPRPMPTVMAEAILQQPEPATPQKGDLDRKLSELMHASRHQLEAAQGSTNQLSELLAHGRVVVERFIRADEVQKLALEQAKLLIVTFVQRTGRPASEVVEWARPHLENLNRSLIGAVLRGGAPEEYQRNRSVYEAIFSQRLDGLLRDIEIGYETEQGFTPIAGRVGTFASRPNFEGARTGFGPSAPPEPLNPQPMPTVFTETLEETMFVGETVSVERRLSEHPQDIREAARGLSRAISEQIDELNALKPNDPDALSRQETFVAFMQRIATGLDELAASLERISIEPSTSRGPLYAKSAAIARGLGKSVMKGLEENRASIMACSLRVPVVFASTGLLHLLGVSPDMAAAIAAGLMGIDAFRSGGRE